MRSKFTIVFSSTGFARKSLRPSARNISCAPPTAFAESAMIGRDAYSGNSRRISCVASTPSISGIIWSINIMS